MSDLFLTRHVIVPAGTRLYPCPHKRGGEGYCEAIVGIGPDFTGYLVLQLHRDLMDSGYVGAGPVQTREANE